MHSQKLLSRCQPLGVGLFLFLSVGLIQAAETAVSSPVDAVPMPPVKASAPSVGTTSSKPTVAPAQQSAKPQPKPQPRTKTAGSVSPAPQAAPRKPAVKPTPVVKPKPPSIMPAIRPAILPAISTPQDFCAQVTRTLPSVNLALCARAQLLPTTGRSVWARTIFQRDVMSAEPKLRVLVIGGIHGDELSSGSLVMHWIQLATQTQSNVHWRFAPVINVDGMLMSPPRRTNANGVDLNRNFPTPKWDKEAPVYWANRTKSDPRRYPGPKPLSEPESRWVHDEMERWKPHLIVSVHAPYAVLDFDGPAVPPQRLGRLYLDQVGIFPGSLGNFGGVHKRVPVVTIELPSATQMPSEAETRQMWFDLLRWMGERLGAG